MKTYVLIFVCLSLVAYSFYSGPKSLQARSDSNSQYLMTKRLSNPSGSGSHWTPSVYEFNTESGLICVAISLGNESIDIECYRRN